MLRSTPQAGSPIHRSGCRAPPGSMCARARTCSSRSAMRSRHAVTSASAVVSPRSMRRAASARESSFRRMQAKGSIGPMDRYELIVRNATVIDGTRAPRYQADIAVSGGKIVAIGRLDQAQADVDVDASGKVAAPGFIDSHTHDDRLMLSSRDMAAKVSQGVTTVIAGNCGCSLAPAPNGMAAPVTPPLDLLDASGDWFRFKTFGEYVAQLEATPAATNCALLVGHTMLRLP